MKRHALNLLTLLSLLLCVAVVVLWVQSFGSPGEFEWRGWRVSAKGDVLAVDEMPKSGPLLAEEERRHMLAIEEGERKHKADLREAIRRHNELVFVYHKNGGPKPAEFREPYSKEYQEAVSAVRALRRRLAEGPRQLYSARLPVLAIASAVLPAAWLLLALRRWAFAGRLREARGLCRRCGYDLRATPGRCPEFGTSPATAGASV